MQQRLCLILQGDELWLHEQANLYWQQVESGQRLWLSDASEPFQDLTPHKQAVNYLGREFSLVIFDAQKYFPADGFAAIVGTLRAGGLLLLLTSDTPSGEYWQQRFHRIARHYQSDSIRCVSQPQQPEPISFIQTSSLRPFKQTSEQEQAIKAVIKVVTGHRRRPLVITSDRGRGKSALLGHAAAELIKLGKQRILVTAPSLMSVETLFSHAESNLAGSQASHAHLQWQDAEIRFVAPDALLTAFPETDLLIIDEAAAIPVQMLEEMLKQYSRIVFASTIHGYEGTGRGFALRFKAILDQQVPEWQQISLTQPVRWDENDLLEKFSFDALLLNAEPVDDALVIRAQANECVFEIVDKQALACDEKSLRALFGMMALAHYRTRPSDLQMLLDNEDVSLAVLRYQQHIVASVWLNSESAIEPQLAQQIFDGERRVKGRLLPQSLLVHVGLENAGELNYQRIIRIAVHPALQGKGLGSRLVEAVLHSVRDRCDVIGTSFALDERVLAFWQHNHFSTVRLGQHADQVSASVSVMMLHAFSETGRKLLNKAQKRLTEQWPFLLGRTHRDLSSNRVLQLSKELYVNKESHSATTLDQIRSFAFHQRPYESCEFVLWQWLSAELGSPNFSELEKIYQQILIQLVMQQNDIQEVAQSVGLTGRAALIKSLRAAVAQLLQLSCETR